MPAAAFLHPVHVECSGTCHCGASSHIERSISTPLAEPTPRCSVPDACAAIVVGAGTAAQRGLYLCRALNGSTCAAPRGGLEVLVQAGELAHAAQGLALAFGGHLVEEPAQLPQQGGEG